MIPSAGCGRRAEATGRHRVSHAAPKRRMPAAAPKPLQSRQPSHGCPATFAAENPAPIRIGQRRPCLRVPASRTVALAGMAVRAIRSRERLGDSGPEDELPGPALLSWRRSRHVGAIPGAADAAGFPVSRAEFFPWLRPSPCARSSRCSSGPSGPGDVHHRHRRRAQTPARKHVCVADDGAVGPAHELLFQRALRHGDGVRCPTHLPECDRAGLSHGQEKRRCRCDLHAAATQGRPRFDASAPD